MSGHDHDHHHHHDHDHSELSETELRVRALESILTEKGYVEPAALDAIIEAYETRIGPRFCHHADAVARADLLLVEVDQEIKRSRIDIAFFGQDRFQRADAQLRLRQLGMVVIVVVMMVVVVVIVPGHSGKIEYDPEKWRPVFRKDHAQTKRLGHDAILRTAS